jgi:antirestriction protein
METPHIYVASLTDYNHGYLHGKWIDATQDPDSIHGEISMMLAASPIAAKYGDVAEEYAIHDYDGFGGLPLGEYESVHRVCAFAELIQSHPVSVVTHFITENPDSDAAEIASMIEDRYIGEYGDHLEELDAVAEYASQYIEESQEIPEFFRPHLRALARSVANDMLLSGEVAALYEGAGVWHLLSTF